MQPRPLTAEKKIFTMALMVALGVVLHRLEAILPLPSPWIKLGLANVMTLLALEFLGFREAVTVTVARTILGSMVGGTFLGPTFFLSLAGGLAATGIMALLYKGPSGRLSLIGISATAACTHTLTVFSCVYFFFIPRMAFLQLVPFFLSCALVSGCLTGAIANHLVNRLTLEGVFVPQEI